MGYLPLFLNVENAACLVVGGGQTALRKTALLLEAGAHVVAVSPDFIRAFAELQTRFGAALTLCREPYRSGDLSGYRLVFAATDDHALNRTIAGDGERANLWVNVVDEPALCSALCGAVLRRGPLQVAVSTGGACPTLAVTLRDALAERYTEETGEFTAALGALRPWLLERCPDVSRRRRLLSALVSETVRTRCSGLSGEGLLTFLRGEAEGLLERLDAEDRTR